ncbi:major facilitator superfamily domain-containing protein, partial [Thamnocephalis sphaerospora]
FRLALAILLAALDQTIVATAVERIAEEFGGREQISWVATAYLLTSTAFQPLYGRFSDIFGRRALILIAIIIFLAGSLGCGLAWSMVALIVFRAIAGIGGAGLMSLVLIILTDIVAPKRSGQFQGAIGAIFALSSIIGPLIGGLFTDHLTWRWAFYVNLPIGAITVVVVVLALRLPPVPGSARAKIRRVDWAGSLLIIATNVALLLATSWGGQDYPWDHPAVIALFCVGAVFLAITVWWEGWGCESRGGKKPLIPGRLFRHRNIVAILISVFFMGWCFFCLVYYFPIYYQRVHRYSATDSGLALIPLILTVAILSFVTSTLATRVPWRWIYRVSMAAGAAFLIIASGVATLLGEQQREGIGLEIGILVIYGFGIGLSIQTSVLAAQACAGRRDMAVVTALVTFTRVIGGVFGLAIMGAVLNNSAGGAIVTSQNTSGSITTADQQQQADDTYAFRQAFILFLPAAVTTFVASLFVDVPAVESKPRPEDDTPVGAV